MAEKKMGSILPPRSAMLMLLVKNGKVYGAGGRLVSSIEKKIFDKYCFHPVVEGFARFPVLDLSQGPVSLPPEAIAVGKYLELRPNLYTTPNFAGRDLHMGVDLVLPAGTPLLAPWDMKVLDRAYLGRNYDYGYCLLTKILWPEASDLYVLWGHLSKTSFDRANFFKVYKAGDKFADVGKVHENGGWHPHVHVQLSWNRPQSCDMPGVVSQEEKERAQALYPDPRWILGNLY